MVENSVYCGTQQFRLYLSPLQVNSVTPGEDSSRVETVVFHNKHYFSTIWVELFRFSIHDTMDFKLHYNVHLVFLILLSPITGLPRYTIEIVSIYTLQTDDLLLASDSEAAIYVMSGIAGHI